MYRMTFKIVCNNKSRLLVLLLIHVNKSKCFFCAKKNIEKLNVNENTIK